MLLEHERLHAANAANMALITHHTYLWPNGESGLYRPLTTFSYLLNYAILGNGNRPAGYHWINFFLHKVNVLLLFTLMLRLTQAFRTAFFVAMLWAIHPVLTESVTNIIGRADLLAGFAVLCGFLLYLHGTGIVGLSGLAAVTAIGVFSKESAIVLPGVIVLYEMVLGRQWRRMVRGLIATVLPIAVMLWLRASVLSDSMPAEYPFVDNPITGAGFWIGRLTALKILARYLWLAIWPLKLSADYSYSEIPLASGTAGDWICWTVVLAVLAITIVLWRRNRLAFFFAAFAFLNLLPASNLLFPIGTIMAERLLYLPLAGLLAAAITAIAPRIVELRGFAIGVAVIAAAFTVRTWIRNNDWTDDNTMAAASVRASPNSYNGHRLLAATRFEDPAHRDLEGAIVEADRSVAILAPLPDELDVPGPWNLASACHRAKGDDKEAIKLALRSIAVEAASRGAYDRKHGIKSPVPPNAAGAYRTLASAYLDLHQAPEALAASMEAKTIDSANAVSYEEMADANMALGRGEEAALALAEGMFASGDRGLLNKLMELYRHGVDTKGCAIKDGPRGPTLNPSCEIVMRDLCGAIDRLHRPDLGTRFGCPSKP